MVINENYTPECEKCGQATEPTEDFNTIVYLYTCLCWERTEDIESDLDMLLKDFGPDDELVQKMKQELKTRRTQ